MRTDENAEQAGQVAAGRYPFLLPDEDKDVRYFFVDGEDMAEGGVEDQLRRMAPALAAHGVQLQVELVTMPSDPDEGDYGNRSFPATSRLDAIMGNRRRLCEVCR